MKPTMVDLIKKKQMIIKWIKKKIIISKRMMMYEYLLKLCIIPIAKCKNKQMKDLKSNYLEQDGN